MESALPAAAANGMRIRSADATAGSPNWSSQSCVSARQVASVNARPTSACAPVVMAREVSRKLSARTRAVAGRRLGVRQRQEERFGRGRVDRLAIVERLLLAAADHRDAERFGP